MTDAITMSAPPTVAGAATDQPHEIRFTTDTAKAAKEVTRAYAHPLRMKMLDIIKAGNGLLTVSDIYGLLRMEQAQASQHLAILRRAGLVTTERGGKFIYYSIDPLALSQAKNAMQLLALVASHDPTDRAYLEATVMELR